MNGQTCKQSHFIFLLPFYLCYTVKGQNCIQFYTIVYNFGLFESNTATDNGGPVLIGSYSGSKFFALRVNKRYFQKIGSHRS